MFNQSKFTLNIASILVMSLLSVPIAVANTAALKERLREAVNLPIGSIDALMYALDLREINRNAIRSLDVAYVEMSFSSPHRLRQASQDLYQGIVPIYAIPNPKVLQVHFIKQGNSVYIRTREPYSIIMDFLVDDPNPVSPGENFYFPVEVFSEFTSTGAKQVSVYEKIPLVSDSPLQPEERRVGAISKDGALTAFVYEGEPFSPEIHEWTPLERVVSQIVEGTGVLEDLYIGLDEEGKRVLTIVVKYQHRFEAWARLNYSLDDGGLLISRESIAQQKQADGSMITRTIRESDISFYHHERDGERVVLPTSRLYAFEVNGELREQELLIVDADTLRVNEIVPDDAFHITLTGDESHFNHFYNEYREGEPRLYRSRNELPEDIRALTRMAGSVDGFSSAERFPFDEEWTERLFVAYGGTGGDGGTPFGNIELAQYAQKPVPQTYSGVVPYWWLNGNTLALAFGLFLIVGGLVLRNLPARKAKQPAAQPVL